MCTRRAPVYYQLKAKQQDRAWGEQRPQQGWGRLGHGDTGDLPGALQSLVAMWGPRHPLLPAHQRVGYLCLHGRSLRCLGMGTWRDLIPWLEGARTLSAGTRGGSSFCPCPCGCGSSKSQALGRQKSHHWSHPSSFAAVTWDGNPPGLPAVPGDSLQKPLLFPLGLSS